MSVEKLITVKKAVKVAQLLGVLGDDPRAELSEYRKNGGSRWKSDAIAALNMIIDASGNPEVINKFQKKYKAPLDHITLYSLAFQGHFFDPDKSDLPK